MLYEQAQLRTEALQAPTLGPGTEGGYGYAVAIEDGADLRVTLWVGRGPKICVVLQPRNREWNRHATHTTSTESTTTRTYGVKQACSRARAIRSWANQALGRDQSARGQ